MKLHFILIILSLLVRLPTLVRDHINLSSFHQSMMNSRTIFRSIAKQSKSPSQVLTEANDLLCAGNDTGMFVTAILVYYHLPTGLITYSNGGHNPALLFGPGGVCRKLAQKQDPALGICPGLTYKEDTDTLEPSQVLFLYTDGVTEASSPQDEFFGVDRLTKLVRSCKNLILSQMVSHIDKELKAFQQGNQFDDITVLALKRVKKPLISFSNPK